MKKIEAVIRPEKLNEVRMALEKAGYPGIMISEIEGHGKQKGVTLQWRGEQYKVDLLPKIKIEIVVKDSDTEQITKTVVNSARVGETGDGKIFISEIAEVVRIRTGEKGESAL